MLQRIKYLIRKFRSKALATTPHTAQGGDSPANEVAQDPWDQASVADWWETVHRNDEVLWLTGSEPEHVWKFLGVEGKMRRGQTILNVGIGLGYDTHALHERGLRISALDISPTALARVRNITQDAWLATELDRVPHDRFDWILSYLVAQHMSDADLRDQFRHLIPALKQNGIFAIQFAESPGTDVTRRNTSPQQKLGGACRSYDEMEAMATECGGRIAWRSEPWIVPAGSGTVFHAIHIMKGDHIA